MTTEHKTKVLIVDDHPMLRERLSVLINQQKDLVVCGEAEDADKALAIITASKPGLAIVDISLKNSNGIDLVKQIHQHHPKVPVLVLTMHDESLYGERALRAGALGYITKQEATDKVMTAIRRVLSGEMYLSERLAARMVGKFVAGTPGTTPLGRLSDRELEVFQLIGRGLGTRQIAETLRLDVKTIETYRGRIKDKLALGSATELVQYATQWMERAGTRGQSP